jgi:protein-S-isoprenylcysteine O-methyltransferase Ste14
VFGALTSASYRHAVDGGLGVVLATAGALLNLSGWRWMQRTIIRATT